MSDIVKALADYYPLETLLEENDIEVFVVVDWLVEEGLIDLKDYIYLDEEEVGEDD